MNTCSIKINLLFLFFLLVFVCKASLVFSLTDTTLNKKQNYALNDPRNPDCPCHKQQQLADEEYARLQKKNAKLLVNIVSTNLKKEKAVSIPVKSIDLVNTTNFKKGAHIDTLQQLHDLNVKTSMNVKEGNSRKKSIITTGSKRKSFIKLTKVNKIKFVILNRLRRIKKPHIITNLCFHWN